MSVYLGDYAINSTVYFLWSTNAANGSAASRDFDGDIRVYKDADNTYTEIGITDFEDFDSIIGIHSVSIDTSESSFYTGATDYHVVLVGATVDNVENINAVLAEFSITNRA